MKWTRCTCISNISLSRLLNWVMGVACAKWLPPILGREVCSLLPIELPL